MKYLSAATVSLIVLAPVAAAQESAPYIDAGVQYLTTDALGSTIDITTVNARLGYDFSRHFGVELEGATGIDTWSEGIAEISLDYAVAGYGRLKAPLSRSAEVYGKIGYSLSQFDAQNTLLVLDDEQSLVFGTGVTFLVAGNTGVRLDYSRYTSDVEDEITGDDVLDLNVDSFSVSLYRRF